VAYHSYANGGGFLVCETISLWGPLTPDTCVSTICTPVFIATLGVGTEASVAPLRAWPIPAREQLFVEGLPPDCDRIEVLDALGRVVYTGSVDGRRSVQLDAQAFSRGVHVVRTVGAIGARSIRIILE
jgi:hypothetical protein